MSTSTRLRTTHRPKSRYQPLLLRRYPTGEGGQAPPPPPPPAPAPGTAAGTARPLVELLLGRPIPLRFEFFDGSTLGPDGGPGTVRIRSADALRRLLWAPGELGLARAFVCGDIELDGDIIALLGVAQRQAPTDLRFLGLSGWSAAFRAARDLGAFGPPLPPPQEEVLPHGRRHSARRDATSVSHHYDVGNDFYRLFLGPTMAYSCARFTSPDMGLDAAEMAKYELVCRKLGLHQRPGARLLDVGCGWGSMAIHAAACHGAQVVGVTVSREQAELARRRVDEAGLGGQVEIRIQDYRDVPDADFDAISSIGMFEHVGKARQDEYFETMRARLRPGGRLLNHAISTPGSSRMSRRSFMYRYVFPDGELIDVGEAILAMERAGFEVRDVESLREHYVKTLHAWVSNLEARWDEAVALVGLARARIWRIYMAGSANRFETGAIAVHQVLGVVPDADGRSGMPPTRSGWD